MNRNVVRLTGSMGLALLGLMPALASNAAPQVSAETRKLQARMGASTSVSIHPATGVARFVRMAPDSQANLSPLASGKPEAQARAFFAEYAGLFGITDAQSELRLVDTRSADSGAVRLTFQQVRSGVPVFAALLRAHFDATGRLHVVNGVFVPDVAGVGVQPRVRPDQAGATALDVATTPDPERPAGSDVPARVLASRLTIFRTGLVQGVAGESRLAYQIDVSNGGDIRRDVFVDALTGKVLDSYSRVHDALDRRAYDGAGSVVEPGPNYPATPFWVEGQVPFPTGTAEADNMIFASGETFTLFKNGFGYDTGGPWPFFPATAGQMHPIFNRGWGCPNASWNSTYISFCPGFTTDDVTAHEWGHAYTEFTSGLIYFWQSGAINEAYSDMYGEVVDLLNGRGLDTPNTARLPGQCSTVAGAPPPDFTVTAPAGLAGQKVSSGAAWNTGTTNLSANVQLANDGTGASTSDGCEAFTVTAGSIALVDRGNCPFVQKVDNAFAGGAAAIVIANNTTGLLSPGGAPTNPIPGVMILQTDGAAIKAALLGGPVSASLVIGPATDPSLRWLMGEEVTGGALRDMWNPQCFGDPGKVSDQAQYICTTFDNGGVHINSGIVNHLFALLTDGGTYNGRTVTALGSTKATHLIFRAQSQYLVPSSNFADFADAMEQSCTDLLGQNLATIATSGPGGPSGQIITAANCASLAQGILAVELRTPPTFCNFQPLLSAAAATLCPAGQVPSSFLSQTFETNPFSAGWAATTGPTSPDFTPRAWVWDNSLPSRLGSAVFAVDPPGGTCAPGGDESGVIQLESPTFVLPAGASRLAFDHWLASEAQYDGGNLKVSVNAGAFTVVPAGNLTFNTYVGGLSGAGSTNPMFGQPGFSGTDGGSNSGSWGTTVVDLTGIATAGQSVKLRFDFGTDGCGGVDGWYLDNLSGYTCVAAGGGNPAFSINDTAVVEGDAGTTNLNFTVSMSPADGTGPHSVQYSTSNGSASTSDSDYFPAGGTLVFNAGETSKTVTVSVVGDNKGEPNEQFTVTLSNPTLTDATIADGTGVGTIVDDDAAKGDFNGDGLPDLVFRSNLNGTINKVWFMDGVTRTAEANITPNASSAAWLIRGVHDFDSAASPGSGPDNKNDLVFWNQTTGAVEFWLMDGTNRPGATVPLTGATPLALNWDLSATADFDHDAKPEIVWRNFSSQLIVIWKMNGTVKVGNITPSPNLAVNSNWIIVAAADYNNDGNTDFLWYNFTSGRIVTWYMNASVVRISGQFTTPDAAGNNNWKVVASSDFSRSYVPGTPPIGSPDIIWRNETSGNQVVWHLDYNSTRVFGEFTKPAANALTEAALDWFIVGPR